MGNNALCETAFTAVDYLNSMPVGISFELCARHMITPGIGA